MDDPSLLSLLEFIPEERLTARQKEFSQIPFSYSNGEPRQPPVPVYNIPSQETERTSHFSSVLYPSYSSLLFKDIATKVEKYRSFLLWRVNNESFICISLLCDELELARYWDPHVAFRMSTTMMRNDNNTAHTLVGAVYAETVAAVAETATFFWSLQDPQHPPSEKSSSSSSKNNTRLQLFVDRHWTYGGIHEEGYRFDYMTALHPMQLAQILDANPTRSYVLQTGTWSTEQSLVLATRSFPVNLKLVAGGTGFAFHDEGTAFIDALEKRPSTSTSTSALGVLSLNCASSAKPFGRSNLERLFQISNIMEKLAIKDVDEECALLPFAAKVNALEYEIDASFIRPEQFPSLSITAKDLQFVAALGYFERLSFSLDYKHRDPLQAAYTFDQVVPASEALIRAIRANLKLRYLDVNQTVTRLDWAPHFKDIFPAVEDHPRLRTLVVQCGNDRVGYTSIFLSNNRYQFDYSCLGWLLSRIRNMTVLDRLDRRCWNGWRINDLYVLNAFLNGSAALVKASTNNTTTSRPFVVALALVEKNAASNLPHTALLLAHHTDILCEFVEDRNDSQADDTTAASLASIPESSSMSQTQTVLSSERKSTTMQLTPDDARKAARTEPASVSM